MANKKISRHYRIREDILQELNGMLVLVNKNIQEGEKEVTETYIVEGALVMFINRWKKQNIFEGMVDTGRIKG